MKADYELILLKASVNISACINNFALLKPETIFCFFVQRHVISHSKSPWAFPLIGVLITIYIR